MAAALPSWDCTQEARATGSAGPGLLPRATARLLPPHPPRVRFPAWEMGLHLTLTRPDSCPARRRLSPPCPGSQGITSPAGQGPGSCWAAQVMDLCPWDGPRRVAVRASSHLPLSLPRGLAWPLLCALHSKAWSCWSSWSPSFPVAVPKPSSKAASWPSEGHSPECSPRATALSVPWLAAPPAAVVCGLPLRPAPPTEAVVIYTPEPQHCSVETASHQA